MSEKTDPIDVAVGARIRARREALGITQAKLADASEVTFQQIQKYERGTNRVSVSRLVLIAAALKAHPAEFFDNAEASDEGDALSQLRRLHDGMPLAEAYLAMQPDQRSALMIIVRALANGASAPALKLVKAA